MSFRLVETCIDGKTQPPVPVPSELRGRQILSYLIDLKSTRIEIQEQVGKRWTPVLFWQIGGHGIQRYVVPTTRTKGGRHAPKKAKRR